MSDLIFEDPKLVEIYDSFDGKRDDLIHYVEIIKELKAKTILDIGSGTGCLAGRLVSEGLKVICLEPAEASLLYAKRKSFGHKVDWILGDTSQLSNVSVDIAIMTGNVAQVFTTDESWVKNLKYIKNALNPSGYLVFEVRDPTKKAWRDWNKEKSFEVIDIPNIGKVEGWVKVLNIADELVTFRWTYHFQSTGETLTSDSTLRFRSKKSIISSLNDIGFKILEIRDAPDRPKKEFVFIAQSR